jgi:glycogen debranching enzyme
MAASQSASVLERTVLKSGQLFLVADRGGDIKALNVEGHGLYFHDMRHLSLFEMDILGTRLTLLSATDELNSLSEQQFTNDALMGQHEEVLAEARTISIRRSRFLHGKLHEQLELFNYNPHPLSLTLRFTFGCDFRDMFDVRGFEVEDAGLPGQVEPISILPDSVVLGYRGREGMRRQTRITFDPPPEHVEIVNATLRQVVRKQGAHLDQRDEGLIIPPIAAAAFNIVLPANQGRAISINATPRVHFPAAATTLAVPFASEQVYPTRETAVAELRHSYEAWRSAATQIETDHELFNEILNRALLDLHLLVEGFDGDLVPTAGIPWFAVPFGRDSLITAMQTLSVRPAIAKGTLRFLARYQGKRVHRTRGEEPGKILHEVRPGEAGGAEESIYYGSIDSTPLFLMALGEYVAWSDDLELARELLTNAEAALAWMDDYGDLDGDGFIESNRYPAEGLGNQGWKDSPDSITHRNGELASAPHALAEVQAYRFAAHRHMALLYARLGDADKQHAQTLAAERIRRLFVERLAMSTDQGPFWAMGLDSAKRRIETVTSNPGHALWAGLLRDADAELTVRRLLAEDMQSGWGIRTLSSRALNYNPMSYHNGSVWPHDTALITLGMKRAGADAAACQVASDVLEAGLRFPGARLPELWCGFPRDRHHAQSTPAQYPVGCSPQAWAAGSAFMLLQALLGLEADAHAGVLRLQPNLPPWIKRLRYRNLHVAGECVDFEVVREGKRLVVEVADAGGLRIERADAAQLACE